MFYKEVWDAKKNEKETEGKSKQVFCKVIIIIMPNFSG